MAAVSIILEAMVCLSWLIAIFEQSIGVSIVAMCAGSALFLVGVALTTSEAAQAWRASRIAALAIVAPVILMSLQCVPGALLGHQIWIAAAAALNERMFGYVTIDIGATVISLCQYVSLTAILIISMFVAVNRRRADALLFVLASYSVAFTLSFYFLEIVAPNGVDRIPRSAIQAMSAFAVLLSVGVIARTFQRYEMLNDRSQGDLFRIVTTGIVWLIGALACFAVNATIGSELSMVGIFCGLVPMITAPFIQRFARREMEFRLASVVVTLLAVGSFAVGMLSRPGDITLRVSTAEPTQIHIAQRMLSDNHWFGTGAGTYASLVSFYRAADDPRSSSVPPTTAANLTITMGRIVFSAFILMDISIAFLLFNRSLRRTRDWFYSAMGAGFAYFAMFAVFIDNGVAEIVCSVVLSSVVGLALAQSQSTRRFTR